MTTMKGSGLLLGLGALLAAGVVLQFAYSLREEPQAQPRLRLAELIARQVPDWTVVDEPIGMTEATSEAALKTLNLDDFVYRRYQRGGRSFTVYAAYWAAGKMPTRLVASHTPDRCWTENGMRCVDLKFKQTYAVQGHPLLPADWRVFVSGQDGGRRTEGGERKAESGGRRTEDGGRRAEKSSERQAEWESGPRTYVVYWHLVEGKLYDYGERFNAIPDPWRWWKDTVEQAAYGSREQLFVRIASETPLEQLWVDPGVQAVLESVAKLGLYAPASR